MAENKASASAGGVALMRAIETEKPEALRICDDPIATAMLPKYSPFTLWLFKGIINSAFYDRLSTGALGMIVLRERYIDDFLKASLSEGLDQVVILGAGFDTRAYRTAGIEQTRVFEIDQPATQADKLERLKKVIDPLPANVTFLTVDFNTQTLAERLLASGYNEQGKTLFIWQGVTYFLAAEGVESTLAFIANHSGPGSAVIFDYMYTETLHSKRLQQAAKTSGEPYLFGIDADQIEPFLAQRGFGDIKSKDLAELKKIYFIGKNAGRRVPTGIAIASARVDNAH
jgi:methyltransferase (TIGR00027 family)